MKLDGSLYCVLVALCGCGDDEGNARRRGGSASDHDYSDQVKSWPADWVAREDQILAIVNQRRSEGASCGSEGYFGPAPPLGRDDRLRCAARNHSMDMAENDYFDHTNLDNELPWDRMQRCGYAHAYAGENISYGRSGAAQTMSGWMQSDGHCANIMSRNFTEIGVGYYLPESGGAYESHWTQVFAAPR